MYATELPITAAGQSAVLDVGYAGHLLVHLRAGAAVSGLNIVFEGSMDSTNGTDGTWFAITAARTNANTVETTATAIALGAGTGSGTGWRMNVADIKYARVRATTLTAGDLFVLMRASAAVYEPAPNLPSVGINGLVASSMRTIHASGQLTSTLLAANAAYTSGTIDGGTDTSSWPTRIRPIIRHLTAAPVHGYLVLLESSDNATFIETKRTPIPADGAFRSFDWPVHLRYSRVQFINGNQAQTGMRLDYTTYRGEGSSVDEDKVLAYVLSTAALAASASFTSQTFDLGPNSARNLFRAFAGTDAAGGQLRVQWSDDNTNWFSLTSEDVTTVANGRHVIESKVIARYVRVNFANGTTAQTALRLWASLVSL